jgi:hypothetical protein
MTSAFSMFDLWSEIVGDALEMLIETGKCDSRSDLDVFVGGLEIR